MGNPIPSRDADTCLICGQIQVRHNKGVMGAMCPIYSTSFRSRREFEAQIRADAYEQAAKAAADPLVDLIRNWMMSEDYPVSQWERDFAAAIRALSDQPDSANEGLAELLREARECIEGEFGTTKLVERIDTALSTGRQA